MLLSNVPFKVPILPVSFISLDANVASLIFKLITPDKLAPAKVSFAEELVPAEAQFDVPKSKSIKEFKSASLKS
jgi:hypothetical protein